MDGSVFIDFNKVQGDKIALIRISFDGYGCCNLGDKVVPLDKEESTVFKSLLQNEIINQDILTAIVKKAIALNKDNIWMDALKKYNLI